MTDSDAPVDPPRYPTSDEPDGETMPGQGRGTRLAIAAIVVVVVMIVLLHLTGVVGPTAH